MSARGCQRPPGGSTGSGSATPGAVLDVGHSCGRCLWAPRCEYRLPSPRQPCPPESAGLGGGSRPSSPYGKGPTRDPQRPTSGPRGFRPRDAKDTSADTRAAWIAFPPFVGGPSPLGGKASPLRRAPRKRYHRAPAPEAGAAGGRRRRAAGDCGRPARELPRAAGRASLSRLRRRLGSGWPGAASGCPWGAGGRAGDAGRPWTPLRSRCRR